MISRVRYKTVDAEGATDVITAAMPSEMLPRSILAPSFVSNMLMENVGKGMPLFRIEDTLRRDGLAVVRRHVDHDVAEERDPLADVFAVVVLPHAVQLVGMVQPPLVVLEEQQEKEDQDQHKRRRSYEEEPKGKVCRLEHSTPIVIRMYLMI